MLDDVNRRLDEHRDYAVNDLRYLGFIAEDVPEVVFSPCVPGGRIASYDPKDDVIKVGGIRRIFLNRNTPNL